MTTDDQKVTAPPPISEIIAKLDAGAEDTDAGVDFAELVKSVQTRNTSGSINIKLTVSPINLGQIQVEIEHKVSPPKGRAPVEVMWVTPEGGLTRSDPNQMQLTYDPATGQPVNPTTGEIQP